VRESLIEAYLAKRIKDRQGWTLKLFSFSVKGLPDRMVLYKGNVYFVELKALGKKPSKVQLYIHKKLGRLGFNVFVIDSKEGVDEFMEQWIL